MRALLLGHISLSCALYSRLHSVCFYKQEIKMELSSALCNIIT